MSLFRIFDVASSALTAQSQRLNTVASNLANAESPTSSFGEVYKAKQVVFEAVPLAPGQSQSMGVRVKQVIDDPAPPRMVYEPSHPLANAQGYVTYPNVDVVEEMANMISASRSYQMNADMMNTAKSLMLKTLSLGQ